MVVVVVVVAVDNDDAVLLFSLGIASVVVLLPSLNVFSMVGVMLLPCALSIAGVVLRLLLLLASSPEISFHEATTFVLWITDNTLDRLFCCR